MIFLDNVSRHDAYGQVVEIDRLIAAIADIYIDITILWRLDIGQAKRRRSACPGRSHLLLCDAAISGRYQVESFVEEQDRKEGLRRSATRTRRFYRIYKDGIGAQLAGDGCTVAVYDRTCSGATRQRSTQAVEDIGDDVWIAVGDCALVVILDRGCHLVARHHLLKRIWSNDMPG